MLLNILVWNSKIGSRYYFVGLRPKGMINRDSWGICIALSEVNVLDESKTNYCDSGCLGYFH